MKQQLKLITALIIAAPLYLTGCQGMDSMFDDGYQERDPNNYGTQHSGRYRNTTIYERHDAQGNQPQQAARTNDGQTQKTGTSQETVEVVPTKPKNTGPSVPLEAPSVSGMQ